MTNQFAIQVIGWGGVVPTVVAIAVAFGCIRLLPSRIAIRYAAACGVGVAFFVGYALLPTEFKASLRPSRYWHWLPHLGTVAMVIGPIGQARGLSVGERWMLFLLLATLAACLLVPTWEDLSPQRLIYVPLLAGYLLLLTVFLDPLPARITPRLFAVLLWFVAACSAGAVWGAVSETYGRLGAIAASAMMGACIACWFIKSNTTLRAIVPVYAVMVGGTAFVGFVYPEKSEYAIMLVPAAPVALWIGAWGPLGRVVGGKAVVIQTASVLIPLIIAVLLLFRGHR